VGWAWRFTPVAAPIGLVSLMGAFLLASGLH